MFFLVAALTLPACDTSGGAPSADSECKQDDADPVLAGTLSIVRPGQQKSVIPVSELARRFGVVRIESQDPNYDAKKTFTAIQMAPMLGAYFDDLADAKMLLVASDGYSVQVPAAKLESKDAFVAIGESSAGQFSPIGPRGVDPGPLYLVWRGSKYTDDKKYPRPWALTTIELLDSADRYAHTQPSGGFGDNLTAKKGYQLFSESCIRCHAINREGGSLGPDLNVPQNILAYRPESQVRAYIQNPETFRYSNMPAHEHLSSADLDALIAYLRVMGQHPYDRKE